MCGKGSNTTTTQTAANPQAMAAYSNTLNQAAQVASTPYQAYTGQEVAPVNAQQTTGIGGINAAAGQAQPGITAGFGQIQSSTQPLTAAQIQQYESPYTQNVVDATQAEFNNQNGQQNAKTLSSAGALGALGGDRVGVTQALDTQQENLAQAPVIAGLENQGYTQALQTAEQEQQTGLQGGMGLVNAATAGQTAGLQGAGAQISAGTLEQQTTQAQDTQAMQDYYQQQGYPFQVAQWLAGIETGVGSNMGGTGVTQGPTPNPYAQIAGLGVAAAGAFAKRGGRISGFAPPRRNRASGGYSGPWAAGAGWVPNDPITKGKGPPSAPAAPKQQGLTQQQVGAAGKGIGALWNNTSASDASSDYASDMATGDAGTGGFGAFMAAGEARGGRVKRYASGGFATGGGPYTTAGLGATAPAYDDGGDVFGDDNRAAGYDLLRQGFGTTAPDTIPGGEAPPSGVINPDEPYRMPDEAAMDDWRSGVDHPNPAVVADDTGNNVVPFKKTATRGVGLPKEITGDVSPDDTEPGQALGYDGAPKTKTSGFAPPQDRAQADDQAQGLLDKVGIHLSPSAKHSLSNALMQAGFAMMATTRGGPGSFLGAAGEAGMAGVGAYSKDQQQQHEAEVEREKLDMAHESQDQKIASAPLIRAPNGAMMVNPAYKAQLTAEAEIKAKEFKPQLVKKMNPATGTEDFYTYNPNTQKLAPLEMPDSKGADNSKYVSQAAPKEERRKALPASPEARDEGYVQWLDDHRPPGYSDVVRAVADYEIDPNREASLQKSQRDQLYRDVKLYDPTYDQTHFSEKVNAIRSFSTGQDRVAVNSLNVAVSHLAALKDLGAMLNNGQYPLINRMFNQAGIQMGGASVTNFNAAKEIVGDEVVKAIVGGVNSQADRDAIKHLIMAQQSPAQLQGTINTFTSLLGGQLEGRRQGYQAGTGLNNFDQKYLSSATREALKSSAINPHPVDQEVQRAVYPSGIPVPQKGATGSASGPPQASIDMLRKDPSLAAHFDEKYGAGAARRILGQ